MKAEDDIDFTFASTTYDGGKANLNLVVHKSCKDALIDDLPWMMNDDETERIESTTVPSVTVDLFKLTEEEEEEHETHEDKVKEQAASELEQIEEHEAHDEEQEWGKERNEMT